MPSFWTTSEGLVGEATLAVVLTPVSATKITGDNQTGIVERAIQESIRVQVLDGSGSPIRGARVTFTVQEGGGWLYPPDPPTDTDGVVSSLWTLGPSPDETQSVVATVGELSVKFNATAAWPPLLLVTESPPNARLTLDYSGALKAAGGSGPPYDWALVGGGIPPGMVLHPSGECVLSARMRRGVPLITAPPSMAGA